MVIRRLVKQTMSCLSELLANKNSLVLVPKSKRYQTAKMTVAACDISCNKGTKKQPEADQILETDTKCFASSSLA